MINLYHKRSTLIFSAICFGIQLIFSQNVRGEKIELISANVQESEKQFRMVEKKVTLVDLKKTRYLLLDSRIIESTENAELEVGIVKKYPGNPLFTEDKPWEKRFDNLYGNVIFDEEENLYKCWYSPFIIDNSSQGMTLEQRKLKYKSPPGREMGICYAISLDGLIWNKPALELVEYDGNKQNNIIWRGPHGAGIFKDLYDPDPSRRYKIIFRGLSVSASENGINWQESKHCDGVSVAGDTHNNALWAPTLGRYVAITRTWGDMGREVSRIESNDFSNWTKEEVVLKGKSKDLQPYAMPVFYYGGVYLGLVAIHNQNTDRVNTELVWSPDTKHWNHISPGIPLIPCSQTELSCDYGCVYACANPVFLKNEIRLYYGGSDWLHFSWRNGSLCLATLRPDGFAGYIQESAKSPAVVTTTLIPYSGEIIRINADIEAGGWLKVSIVDENGKDVSAGKSISKTITDGKLSFEGKIRLGNIQLRFEFNNAKVYSFWFDK